MKRFFSRLEAFSLAEALVTLVIVSLIMIAAIPVLTKKKRDTSSEHGRWICTLNSSGEYVSWMQGVDQASETNPDEWAKTGRNECIFLSPGRSRNFAVKAIGGGGGGAAGEFIAQDKYYGGSSFSVSQESDYRVLLIGGGGGGGSKTDDGCDAIPGYGGGSGAIYEGIHRFYPGVNYSVSVGDGGHYDNDDNDDGRNDGAKGQDGSATSLIANSGGNLYLSIVAGGGTGGRNYIKDGTKCKISDYDQGGETGGSYSVRVGTGGESSQKTGVNGRETSASVSSVLTRYSFIAEQAHISFRNSPRLNTSAGADIGYGFGGFAGGGGQKDFDRGTRAEYSSCTGSERCWGQQGGPGLAKIYEFASYIGNAGEAGDVENQFIPSFDGKPVSVKIGRGGIAGTTSTPSEASGGNGGNTYIMSLVATGGKGGTSRKTKITEEKYEQKGHDGARSNLNPDEDAIGGAAGICRGSYSYSCTDALLPLIGQYGAGGGSGSAGYYISGSSQKTGQSKGSAGAPGAVIIEW